jgi:hypothetical protein
MKARLVPVLGLSLVALAGIPARGAGDAKPVTLGYTIVDAQAFGGYTRNPLPDGTLEPETYAFGEGGRWDIGMVDKSMDTLRFTDIARTLSRSLADQSYVPAKDPANTRLLIVVYWGTTSGSAEAPQFRIPTVAGNVLYGGGMTEMNDILNARMLGFSFQSAASPARYDPLNLQEEIEANRYFVGLVAYDFQRLYRHKEKKVLWVTRFSIRERHNAFDQSLPEMCAYASQFFGQDSRGFVVKKLREGRVDLGPLRIFDFN